MYSTIYKIKSSYFFLMYSSIQISKIKLNKGGLKNMDFFRELKENLEKNDTLSKLANGVAEFIGELTEALQDEGILGKDVDIVTQIASSNKLSMASENELNKARTEILKEYANATEERGNLYFIYNKVKGENSYRVWEFNENNIIKNEINKKDLPEEATVNSVMRINENEFVLDEEASKSISEAIRDRANIIIENQNKRIEEYKKEGHTYLVTEDINGRVFLWDSTEKPKYEIEDVNFPEDLKNIAKEGNSFRYQNGTYVHIS